MKKTAPPQIPGLVFVQPLGSGGYADVFLYEQQSPRMPVAVKVLKGEGLTDALRGQFVEEANTMAQLSDHPYIVQVFRSGTSDEGRPYLVMKYYPPPNLAVRARAERFSVEDVLRTGIQLASAVETAHRGGITHRDIKPANVLVSAYGAPGLTDFGIAGRGGLAEGAGPEEAESTDDVGVSVPWAAPEVLYGQSNGDERSDLYSLAATLWHLLVGRSPFEVPGGDNSAYALMPRIRSAAPPPTGRPDVPSGLERLLAQAMAKKPEHRPASALEFARALQSVEQNQRLARTPIVVLDEQGHTTLVSQTQGSPLGPGVVDDDRTRIKSPQTVIAQPGSVVSLDEDTRRRVEGAPTRLSPSSASPAGASMLLGVPGRTGGTGTPTSRYPAGSMSPAVGSAAFSREASRSAPSYTEPTSSLTPRQSGEADGDTVRPPSRGGSGSSRLGPDRPDGPRPAGTGRFTRPAVIWGLVAGLVVLGALVAVLLLRASSTDPATANPTSPTPNVALPGPIDTGPVEGAVFDPPVLRAKPIKGGIVFSWSYPDPSKQDFYRLSMGRTNDDVGKRKPLVLKPLERTEKVVPGKSRCASVTVVRSGVESPASPVVCERAL